MQTDADYQYNQKPANQKWSKQHPGYWKSYRSEHQEYVKRNRILQQIRNRRQPNPTDVWGPAFYLKLRKDLKLEPISTNYFLYAARCFF
jgi:hypothetical protein